MTSKQCYEHALDLARRLRASSIVAWTKIRLARMMAERRRAGDAARARALLEEAHPIVVRQGLAYFARLARGMERAP